MKVISDAGQFTAPTGPEPNHWVEQLRVPDLSVGTYSIPAGGVGDSAPVGPGSVVFVAAGEEHRFTDVTGDFAAFVVFAPAEGARSPGGS
jgi:hypothetical protein